MVKLRIYVEDCRQSASGSPERICEQRAKATRTWITRHSEEEDGVISIKTCTVLVSDVPTGKDLQTALW